MYELYEIEMCDKKGGMMMKIKGILMCNYVCTNHMCCCIKEELNIVTHRQMLK